MKPEHGAPVGIYDVISVRRASSVAGGAGDSAWPAAPMARFGQTIAWIDGRICSRDALQGSPSAAIGLSDPILADLALGGADQAAGYEMRCEGAGAARFAVVDREVLVAASPDGLLYAVLERRRTQEEIRAIQQALSRAGFYEGVTDGQVDASFRQAVSKFLVSRGAAFALKDPALTTAALQALGVRFEAPQK